MCTDNIHTHMHARRIAMLKYLRWGLHQGQTWVRIHMHTCTHTCRTCMHSKHICIYIYSPSHACVCMRVCTRVCMHIFSEPMYIDDLLITIQMVCSRRASGPLRVLHRSGAVQLSTSRYTSCASRALCALRRSGARMVQTMESCMVEAVEEAVDACTVSPPRISSMHLVLFCLALPLGIVG